MPEAKRSSGSGTRSKYGTTPIRFPTDVLGGYFEYVSDIVELNVPLLFGLDLMKRYRIWIDEVENTISQKGHKCTAKLTYKLRQLYREWPRGIILFNKTELEKLHRRFAHPSTRKLPNLLKRARPDQVSSETRKVLDNIVASCNPCQRMAPKPYVFQVSMPEDIAFNHEIIADIMWIDRKPALHVVDRGTHYSAAAFLGLGRLLRLAA